MPLHLIQLTDKEWMDWQAVISIAHLLSANLKAGSYKGAINTNDAGKALRAELTGLVAASDKLEYPSDPLANVEEEEPQIDAN